MIENGWPEPDWSILKTIAGELPGFPLGCLPTPTVNPQLWSTPEMPEMSESGVIMP
jgi:hypothetical protein